MNSLYGSMDNNNQCRLNQQLYIPFKYFNFQLVNFCCYLYIRSYIPNSTISTHKSWADRRPSDGHFGKWSIATQLRARGIVSSLLQILFGYKLNLINLHADLPTPRQQWPPEAAPHQHQQQQQQLVALGGQVESEKIKQQTTKKGGHKTDENTRN